MDDRRQDCEMTPGKTTEPGTPENGTSERKEDPRAEVSLEQTYSDPPAPIAVCDHEGRFIDANAEWLKVFGATSIRHLRWPSLFEMPCFDERTRRRLLQSKAVRFDVRFDHQSPRRSATADASCLSVSVTPLDSNGDHRPSGYVVRAEGSAARQHAENELAARVHELKLSEAKLDERLNQISREHEAIRRMLLDLENSKRELSASNAGLSAELSESDQLNRVLRTSERRLKAVFDSILAGVLVTDAETHEIVDVNSTAATMIGLAKSQIIGRQYETLVCVGRQTCCPLHHERKSVSRFQSVLLTHDGLQIAVVREEARVTREGRDYLVDSFVELFENGREVRR